MRPKGLLVLLVILAIFVMGCFLFTDLNMNTLDFVMPRRVRRLLAMVLVAGTIAYSTLLFQAITNNRILTPSIIGLDALYMLIQTVLIFVFGTMNTVMMNRQMNFLLSVALMVIFSLLLFRVLFQREGRNIFYLLLVGMIFGTLFSSLSTFMQVLIDPNDFLIVQNRMFASFDNIDIEILGMAYGLTAVLVLFSSRDILLLDVLSLGREDAINLGVSYEQSVKRMFGVIAALVAISTALVGSITFLGLLVVNVGREWMKTYRHSYLIIGTMLIAIITLIGGQLVVERILFFGTPINVMIHFVGGTYFLFLLLRENKKW